MYLSSLPLNETLENDNLELVLEQTQTLLQEFAARPDFLEKMQLTFGEQVNASTLREIWTAGTLGNLPEVEVRPESDINGARAAFAAETNTIYLAQELVEEENSETITSIFLEEYGHYLDSQLSAGEVPGDEGAILANLVQGNAFNSLDLAQLQSEDDQAKVWLNGQAFEIEQNDHNSCDPGDLCFDGGKQELTLKDQVGTVSVGDTAELTAEVDASGNAISNITFGILGTEEGEILAVERMDSLGSGTINIQTEVPSQAQGDQLVFKINAVFTAEQARNSFDPDKEGSVVPVGQVSGEDDKPKVSIESIGPVILNPSENDVEFVDGNDNIIEGRQSGLFQIRPHLSASSDSQTISVNYAITEAGISQPATIQQDYTLQKVPPEGIKEALKDNSIQFKQIEESGSIEVDTSRPTYILALPIDDRNAEPKETVKLKLQQGDDYLLSKNNGTAQYDIQDNDILVDFKAIQDGNQNLNKPGKFQVSLNQPVPKGKVTVEFFVGGEVRSSLTPGIGDYSFDFESDDVSDNDISVIEPTASNPIPKLRVQFNKGESSKVIKIEPPSNAFLGPTGNTPADKTFSLKLDSISSSNSDIDYNVANPPLTIRDYKGLNIEDDVAHAIGLGKTVELTSLGGGTLATTLNTAYNLSDPLENDVPEAAVFLSLSPKQKIGTDALSAASADASGITVTLYQFSKDSDSLSDALSGKTSTTGLSGDVNFGSPPVGNFGLGTGITWGSSLDNQTSFINLDLPSLSADVGDFVNLGIGGDLNLEKGVSSSAQIASTNQLAGLDDALADSIKNLQTNILNSIQDLELDNFDVGQDLLSQVLTQFLNQSAFADVLDQIEGNFSNLVEQNASDVLNGLSQIDYEKLQNSDLSNVINEASQNDLFPLKAIAQSSFEALPNKETLKPVFADQKFDNFQEALSLISNESNLDKVLGNGQVSNPSFIPNPKEVGQELLSALPANFFKDLNKKIPDSFLSSLDNQISKLNNNLPAPVKDLANTRNQPLVDRDSLEKLLPEDKSVLEIAKNPPTEFPTKSEIKNGIGKYKGLSDLPTKDTQPGKVAIEGLIVGGKVFLDANGNSSIDEQEVETRTGADGSFSFSFSDEQFQNVDANNNQFFEPNEGTLILESNSETTDIATGLSFEIQLTAPANASVVTPLTTLVTKRMQQGQDFAQAESTVKSVLGIPDSINLTQFNPIAEANRGNPQAQVPFANGAQVQNAVTQVANFLNGATGQPVAELGNAAFSAIAQQLTQSDFALTDETTLATLIRDTAEQANVSLSEAQDGTVAEVASIIVAGQQRIAALDIPDPQAFLKQVTKIQKVSQGDVAQALQGVGSNPDTAASVAEANTGNNLDNQIESAETENIAPPNVEEIVFTIDSDVATGDAIGTVPASDIDDDPLEFAIAGGNPNTEGGEKPAFAIDDSGQLTVADRADLDFSGNLSLSLTVQATESNREGDSALSDTAIVTLNSESTNNQPELQFPLQDQTVTEGQSFEFSFPEQAFNEIDAEDTLSYSARLVNGDNLPDWLSFNAETRTFSGTPKQAGNFEIEVAAADEQDATVSDTFQLSVAETALNPVEGTQGRDRLAGTKEDDRILGKESRDLIRGGEGDDVIKPGSGRDVMVGQAGEDQFVLKPGHGPNQIRDFTLGKDELALGEQLSFADLSISNTRTGTRIAVEESDEVLADLFGIQAENVNESDFTAIT